MPMCEQVVKWGMQLSWVNGSMLADCIVSSNSGVYSIEYTIQSPSIDPFD